MGWDWPPPGKVPPSVVDDLLFLHRFASRPEFAHSGASALSSGERLVRLQMKTAAILDDWRGSVGVAIAASTVDDGRGRRRNAPSSLLAGLALVISLLQGPGAIHQFPSDVSDLGNDARRGIEIVLDSVSRLVDHMSDL